ncbi:hypothetical protein [Jeotgalibaca porci]
MQVFTEEFKTLMAKALAYTIVFGPIVLALLVAGGIERGLLFP